MEPTVVRAAPIEGKHLTSFAEIPNDFAGDAGDGVSFIDRISELAKAPDQPAPAAEEPAAETPEPKAEPKAEEPKAEKKDDEKPKTGVDALLDDDEPAATEKAEAKPEEAEEAPPPGLSKKAEAKWKELKAKAKLADRLEAEANELRAKVAERQKLADAEPLKKALEEKEQRLAELEKKAQIWSLEDSQAWKDAIEKPSQEVAAAAKQIAAINELDEKALFKALSEMDPKRKGEMLAEIAENLPEWHKMKLYGLAQRAEEIFAREDELRANAAAAAEEARSKEAEKAAQARTEARASQMRAVADTVERISKIGKHFAVGDESPDAALEAISAAAQETPWDELTNDSRAFAVVAAAALPRMQKNLKAQMARVAELEKEIASLTASGPNHGGAVAGNTIDETDPSVDFLTAMGIRR